MRATDSPCQRQREYGRHPRTRRPVFRSALSHIIGGPRHKRPLHNLRSPHSVHRRTAQWITRPTPTCLPSARLHCALSHRLSPRPHPPRTDRPADRPTVRPSFSLSSSVVVGAVAANFCCYRPPSFIRSLFTVHCPSSSSSSLSLSLSSSLFVSMFTFIHCRSLSLSLSLSFCPPNANSGSLVRVSLPLHNLQCGGGLRCVRCRVDGPE